MRYCIVLIPGKAALYADVCLLTGFFMSSGGLEFELCRLFFYKGYGSNGLTSGFPYCIIYLQSGALQSADNVYII